LPVYTDLSSREIVTSGKRRAVLVQGWFAISHGILWQMREAQEAWLFWLMLFLEILRVHCGRAVETIKVRKMNWVLDGAGQIDVVRNVSGVRGEEEVGR
jgi:hypothetical protein